MIIVQNEMFILFFIFKISEMKLCKLFNNVNYTFSQLNNLVLFLY